MNDTPPYPAHGPRQTADIIDGYWVVRDMTEEELAIAFPPPPPPPAPDPADTIRAQRDALLAASDWTQLADAPVNQAAWAAYRQALRDAPEQTGFPESVVWPTAPEAA
jgi:hypothetical protein